LLNTVVLRQRIVELEKSEPKRKRATEALRTKTEELDKYFTNSLDLLCIADTDGYFRRLNPEREKVLGYSLSGLEGRRFLDFVHPDDLESTLMAVVELAGAKKVLNSVNRYRMAELKAAVGAPEVMPSAQRMKPDQGLQLRLKASCALLAIR
jgi:PAS domain-containing protein